MPARDFDQARALHAALMELFVANPGGKDNRHLLTRVSTLCEVASRALDDLEARVAIRGVQTYAGLLFSDDGHDNIQFRSLRGPDAVKLQILNCLSIYRERINALESYARAPEILALGARNRLKVVVVEDNSDSAESLRRLLQLCGFQVYVAHSGKEGLAVVKQRRPDVVLCDIGLPDIDGFALAHALRNDPSTADVKLIAVTACGTDEDKERSREAGFQAHLVKPIDPKLLLKQLEENTKH